MIVCVATTPEGDVGGGWGRADQVAIARVTGGRIDAWQEIETGWNALHDQGTEGSHHARIARFLREHEVQCVVAGHMGPGMQQMLGQMGISVVMGAQGSARDAAVAAASVTAASGGGQA